MESIRKENPKECQELTCEYAQIVADQDTMKYLTMCSGSSRKSNKPGERKRGRERSI
jgi:hypothetical protein